MGYGHNGQWSGGACGEVEYDMAIEEVYIHMVRGGFGNVNGTLQKLKEALYTFGSGIGPSTELFHLS